MTGHPLPLLDGYRVLDLSMGWSGPLAGRHLADLGAEVIKVEACQHFDWWRGWEATPEMIANNVIEKAAAYNSMNRNKLEITLDLVSEKGKALLLRLVEISDVLFENNAASVMPKLGLTYDDLCKVNPDIIMLSMPAFGMTEPWAEFRAYGSTVEQASGLPHLTGSEDDPPVLQHVAFGDSIAGLNAASGLLVALWHKRHTGEGQRMDLSQVECLFPFAIHGIVEQSLNGRTYRRLGNRHATHAPHGVFPCVGEDEWVTVAVTSDDEWARLAPVIGLADEIGLAVEENRKAREDEIDAALSAWTSSRSSDAAMRELQGAGVPAGAARRGRDLLTDEHLEARDFWQYVDRDHVGLTPNGSTPYRFGRDPIPIRNPSPTLGEHNYEVLPRLLGLTAEEMAELEAEGVIGTKPVAR